MKIIRTLRFNARVCQQPLYSKKEDKFANILHYSMASMTFTITTKTTTTAAADIRLKAASNRKRKPQQIPIRFGQFIFISKRFRCYLFTFISCSFVDCCSPISVTILRQHIQLPATDFNRHQLLISPSNKVDIL